MGKLLLVILIFYSIYIFNKCIKMMCYTLNNTFYYGIYIMLIFFLNTSWVNEH